MVVYFYVPDSFHWQVVVFRWNHLQFYKRLFETLSEYLSEIFKLFGGMTLIAFIGLVIYHRTLYDQFGVDLRSRLIFCADSPSDNCDIVEYLALADYSSNLNDLRRCIQFLYLFSPVFCQTFQVLFQLQI